MKTISDLSKIKKEFCIVDFYADWCGPCRALSPILKEVESEVKGLKVYKVDTQENPSLTIKHGVRGIPALILFKDGKEVSRKVGLSSKEVLINWVKENS